MNKVRAAGSSLNLIVDAVNSIDDLAKLFSKRRKVVKMLKEYYWYKCEDGKNIQYVGYNAEESKFIFEKDDEFISYDNLEDIDLDSGRIFSLDCDAADFFAERLVDLVKYKKTMHANTEELEEALKPLIEEFKTYASFDEDVKVEDVYRKLMKYYRSLWV